MRARTHLIVLAQALLVWAAFWVAGLPDYYQQYSQPAIGVACIVLSVAISLIALRIFARGPAPARRARAFWLAFYYTVPFAILDTLYCGIYLQHGWAYLHRYWYLTVFYFTPWLTFLPTAALITKLEADARETETAQAPARTRPDAGR